MSNQEQITTDTNEQETTVSDTEQQDMQDATTEDTSTEEAQQEAAVTEDETETEDETDEEHKGGSAREIRYRRRLREAEAERDKLTETVTNLQRTIAEGMLADILDKPASLWLTDHKVEDYFENGQIDAEQLQADARDAVKDLGLGKPRRFHGSADGGVRPEPTKTRRVSWQDALRG